MKPKSPPILCVLLVWLQGAAVAERISYRDGPVPVGLDASVVGQRKTQVRAPGFIDLTELSFASQRQDNIKINIIVVKKNDDSSYPSHDISQYIGGVVDPNYCQTPEQSPVIDHAVLNGFHFKVDLASDGSIVRDPPDLAKWKWTVTESGDYSIIISTCQDNQVYADGFVVIRSSFGYLPVRLIVYAYMAIALLLFGSIITARYGTRLFYTSEIVGTLTEKTVFWALFSMTSQALVYAGHFGAWNANGIRPHLTVYLIMGTELTKHALTFAVAVMMSTGQGYSRTVVALGVWYIMLSLVMGILDFVLQEYRVEQYDLVLTVHSVVSFLYYGTDTVVILLILCFLCRTMRYLKRANQVRKLRRYRALLALLLLVLACAVVVLVGDGTRIFAFLFSELSFVAVLTGMSCLWWPTPESHDYERVMHLPVLDADGNELGGCNEDADEEFGGVELSAHDEDDLFTKSETLT